MAVPFILPTVQRSSVGSFVEKDFFIRILFQVYTQSLVKPYTHVMFIGSTWMHTLHKLNWLLARVVKLLNNFWTGVTYS
jgi:hypothetical protein